MSNIAYLIIIFFLFSFLGWLYEYIAFGKHESDKVSKKLFNIDIPILPIYGLGIIILYLIYISLINYSIWIKVLVAFIFLNMMECILGYISYNFHGYQTWKYNDGFTSCNGYISLKTGIWWTVISFIVFVILEKLKF